MDPKVGRREVRERVTKLLIVAIKTSSIRPFSSTIEGKTGMT